MTKNQKIKELQMLETNLLKKELPEPTILELQIATYIEDLEVFQSKNYNFAGMTNCLGEISSQIIINFNAKLALKLLKKKY